MNQSIPTGPGGMPLAEVLFGFFGRTLPENWHTIRSKVTDSFRVIASDRTV